jgi:hypothetical protein
VASALCHSGKESGRDGPLLSHDSGPKDLRTSSIVDSHYKTKEAWHLVFPIWFDLVVPFVLGVLDDPFRERRLIMTQQLPQSASKSDICNRLGLSESTHRLLLVSVRIIFQSRPLTHLTFTDRSCGC